MKKYLVSLLLSIFLFSCGEDATNTMTVTGNIKGLKKGTLYLQHLKDSVLVTKDSLEIKGDGNFSFRTPLESPEIFYLYLKKKDNNSINDRITFFGEPGFITIKTKWDTFDYKAQIEGSASNKKLEEFKKGISKMNIRNMELAQKLNNAYALNYALNNKDSHIAPYIALFEVADANPKYLDSIQKSLTPEIANSKYGQKLKERLKK